LLWHELSLDDVGVQRLTCGLDFTSTFLAAVFGLAASIAGILLSIVWTCFELYSTRFPSSDILRANGALFRNELGMLVYLYV